jgi:hypothetical protein
VVRLPIDRRSGLLFAETPPEVVGLRLQVAALGNQLPPFQRSVSAIGMLVFDKLYSSRCARPRCRSIRSSSSNNSSSSSKTAATTDSTSSYSTCLEIFGNEHHHLKVTARISKSTCIGSCSISVSAALFILPMPLECSHIDEGCAASLNPISTRSVFCRAKSSLTCEMHPEHRFSIKTVDESFSKGCSHSFDGASWIR